MSELRFNLLTREWVIILKDRAKRPEEFRQRKEKRYRPPLDESCPFCPGNESKTPPEILRRPVAGQWNIRVTPNKFSALRSEGERSRKNEGLKHLVSGVGRHEVIVETNRHDLSMAEFEVGEVREVLDVYRQRFIDCFTDARVQHVIIFKNHGIASGTTLMHAHTQLIGTPVVPIQMRDRVDEAMRYFDYTGECLTCATLREELADGRRIIVDSGNFVSFIPYAALSPFHTWIFPKRHMPSFGLMEDEELEDMAYVLRTTLAKLFRGLDDPDYNFAIRTLSPFRSRSEYIHWYLTIVPQVVQPTGFQVGSGMYVNTSLPEDMAGFLRDVKVS